MKKGVGIGIGVAIVSVVGIAMWSTLMSNQGNDLNFGLPQKQDNNMNLNDEVSINVNPAQNPQDAPSPDVEENSEDVATQPKTIKVNISDGVGTADK